ncbi:MAG: M14 family metallopeptidase, partial [Acidobacteriota bacterium]
MPTIARPFVVLLALLGLTLVAVPIHAGDAASVPILPPAVPWDGASQSLALPPDSDDPWITPSERSGLLETPTYDETFEYVERLVAASDDLRMVSLGRSPEGRDIWMVIASADGAFTPEAMRTSAKPVVMAQSGIHSGEIDGKDAGLMLLRELTVGGSQKHLLDRVHFLFVPIFSVDGHERFSAYNRINQRGPRRMGWRTTARNLNLNRDFAKADSPEMRAMIRALDTWGPDLYVDLHVTDGIDYVYDITWGWAGEQAHSPNIARALEATITPPVEAALEAQGHWPGYLVFSTDPLNPDQGLFKWSASPPRFSDGYGGARHLPTILVENHSLDPYPQRVLGTYVFLAAILDTVGEHGDALRKAVAADRARRPDPIPLGWQVDREKAPERIEFHGVEWRKETSEISGGERVVWLGKPDRGTLPRFEATQVATAVARPAAYWVPATWPEVIERLALHGIAMERIAEAREVKVDLYRVTSAELADAPFEGRVRVALPEAPEVLRRKVVYPPGSVRVPLDQPLGDLAALLLEPQSEDS